MKNLCEGKNQNWKLAKELSNNSRYIDDVSAINLSVNFGMLAKEIYDPSLILEQSSVSGRRDNFLDLHVYIKDGKFVTSIYHKVDDFNFNVINYPFPSSNISMTEGPKCFYSQLIRFARLCSHAVHFCERLQMSYRKLYQRGYDQKALYNRYNHFCANTTDWLEYNMTQADLWKMAFAKDIRMANVHTKSQVQQVVRNCSVSLVDVCGAEVDVMLGSPMKTVLRQWRQDNDADMQTQATTLVNPADVLGDIIVDEHHGFKIIGLENPRNFCYLNSILQILICILLHSGCNYQFVVRERQPHRSNPFAQSLFNFRYKEGYKKSNRRRALLILRSWFSSSISLLNGIQQQDVHEALLEITRLLHNSTVQCVIPDLPSNLVDDDMMTSFPRYIFRFSITTSFTCAICKDVSSISEFVEEITVPTSKCKNLESAIKEIWSEKFDKFCQNCSADTQHDIRKKVNDGPRVLRIVVIRFDSNNNKINTGIDISDKIKIMDKKFTLLGIINHHGSSPRQGHYTAAVKYKSLWSLNDKVVSPYPTTSLIDNKTAYLIFYKQDI